MKEPLEGPTMADYANARWFRKLTKCKLYRPSIKDAIMNAVTPVEVDGILETPVAYLASSGTRRKWVRAAAARRAALRVQALRG